MNTVLDGSTVRRTTNEARRWPPLTRLAALLLTPLLLCSLWLTLDGAASAKLVQAQADVRSYTVVSGDTLGEIATRFGVSLDALVEINQIADAAQIEVGQILLIPSTDATLTAVPTLLVQAMPGETLAMVATRYAQPPTTLAALNGISETQRLFPGQAVRLPIASAPSPSLRFGAVQRINVPDQLAQGRTGSLTIETLRPLVLTATWNGLPLALTPLDAAGRLQFAWLPVPALIGPAPYSVTISYVASNGVTLTHTELINVVDGGYESQEIILPPEKDGLLDPTLVTSETQKVAAIWAQVSPQIWWTSIFSRPIALEYATTSPFGTRRSYNGGPYDSYHAGQDFGAPPGVTVTVPAAGVVVLAEPLQVRGNAVIIDHGRGVFTGYWHLSEIYVTAGQQVVPGQMIGLVGTTGLSTGAHLHWEFRIYGIAVDPLQFLDEPLIPPQ